MTVSTDFVERRMEEVEIETASQFDASLRALCYEAASDGVDITFIIGALENLKLELQLNFLVSDAD